MSVVCGGGLIADSVTTALWKAGYESQDHSEFDSGGGYFNSGTPDVTIVSSPVHGGSFAERWGIEPFGTGNFAVRAFRWTESRTGDDLYYSGWYYVPQQYSFNWWAIMQWKTVSTTRNDPAWFLILNHTGAGGNMRFSMAQYWDGVSLFDPDQVGGPDNIQQSINPTDVPIDQWFHIEAFLHQAKPSEWAVGNGSILKVWINGSLIYDLGPGHADDVNYPSIYEEPAPGRGQEWSGLCYGDVITDPTVIYVDDFMITRRRAYNRKVL